MAPNDSFVMLSTGAKMPKMGLGTWAQTNFINRDQHDPKSLANAVKIAIENGYRHIDTAWAYFNEKEIGVVLKDLFARGVVKREEIFITTKLFPFFFHKEEVEKRLRAQLADLQLDYVDLYLIHLPTGFKAHIIPLAPTPLTAHLQPDPKDPTNIFPINAEGKVEFDVVDHMETWTVRIPSIGDKSRTPLLNEAMEECMKKGLTKHIGLSNFNSAQIQNIMDKATIKPHNLQVECHAYWPQEELKAFCDERKISFTAYSPLGSPGGTKIAAQFGKDPKDVTLLIEEPVVKEMAAKMGKTTAQILIRYLYQRGMVVIPKSTNTERIVANAAIADWGLAEADMAALSGLSRGRILGHLPFLRDHPQYPY